MFPYFDTLTSYLFSDTHSSKIRLARNDYEVTNLILCFCSKNGAHNIFLVYVWFKFSTFHTKKKRHMPSGESMWAKLDDDDDVSHN